MIPSPAFPDGFMFTVSVGPHMTPPHARFTGWIGFVGEFQLME